MNKLLNKFVKILIVPLAFIFNSSASFADNLETFTPVSQLKKIQADDWRYQNLQYLAQRYDCATPFQSDRSDLTDTETEDRPVTRYEFAVGLNSCFQQLEASNNFSDRQIWNDLRQAFASELARLNNRVDNLEANLTQLESQQFSTTTKLEGQVLYFIADSFGGEDESETFTGYRIRLDFNTSFTGQDSLKVRLESREIGRLDDVLDTSLSRLSVDGISEDGVEIGELSYTFTPGENTIITLGTSGVGLNDVGEVLNPFSSSSSGAISRFGRRNPATLRGSGSAGIGIKQKFSDRLSASAGYTIDSENVASPEADGGIFNSSADAIAQILIEPQDELALALTYTHKYQQTDNVNLMGSTGLEAANQPFDDDATTSNNLGIQLNWEITSNFEIGGWFGYTNAQQQDGDESATILNGALTFAFPDLFVENNEGGVIIGVPPTISAHDDDDLVADETPLHIETLYRIEINDNIEITPGVFTVINPDTDDGDAIWVGTVRTKFSF